MKVTKRFSWLMLAALAACGSSTREQPYQGPAGASPAPALVVERFLQAANTNDLQTMTRLFGTSDRTILELDGRQQAEQRMYLLASLLRHQDFSIQGQRSVPGRMNEAAEVMVELTQNNQKVMVPYLVVRREGGGWIIENIDVEALTGG